MAKQRSRKKVGRAAFEANILDGLADPVILIDEHRYFVDGNSMAFELVGNKARGRDLATVLDSPEIIEAIDRVLRGEPTQKGEVFIPHPVSRTYEMRALNLPARNPDKAGWIMLVLHDVSSAKKNEKIRADFVSNLSHELRSPMSSLLGFIETLRGPARDDPEARERFLAIMEAEAKRMARLTNDLLTLSKVETDEHIRPHEPIDIRQILDEVADILSTRAAERGMSIELASPPLLPRIAGNRDELVQIFRNLVDNAINYGREKTVVRVDATCTGDTSGDSEPVVAVAITNQGEGIEPEHIPRLTERFYRVDKGRSRGTGGTGLGLAIVKHIVNRHRGKLEIVSTPGESATATVKLPAKN